MARSIIAVIASYLAMFVLAFIAFTCAYLIVGSDVAFLPGIYASVEQRWSSHRTTGGFYVGVDKNEFTAYTPPREDLPHLFSFLGCMTNAPVRQRLRELSHPRGLIRDTADEFARLLHLKMSAEERREYHPA